MALKIIIGTPSAVYIGVLKEEVLETIGAVWIPKVGPIDPHLRPIEIIKGYIIGNCWLIQGQGNYKIVVQDVAAGGVPTVASRYFLPADVYIAREFIENILEIDDVGGNYGRP